VGSSSGFFGKYQAVTIVVDPDTSGPLNLKGLAPLSAVDEHAADPSRTTMDKNRL
jgi:hypothetical protein